MNGHSWEQKLEGEDVYSIDVDLTQKTSGFYIVRFELSNNEVITKKIIKE